LEFVYVWSIGGYLFIHSLEEAILFVWIIMRFSLMASQKIKISVKIDSIDINDPIEERVFQDVNASG